MYNSKALTEAVSGLNPKTLEKETSDIDKKPTIVINEASRGEAQFKNPIAMMYPSAKTSKPHSFRKDKTTQIL
jgi:hypothetical protein